MELGTWRTGDLERAGGTDGDAPVEEAVAAHAVSLEASRRPSDEECGVAVGRAVGHPGSLARRVIGHLVLEEDVGAVGAGPDHLILLVMLDEQPVGGHVVAVDDNAGVPDVVGPADTAAMVGPPRPDVVEEHTGAIHHEARGRTARRGAPDAKEHVLDASRVRRIGLSSPRRGADLQPGEAPSPATLV